MKINKIHIKKFRGFRDVSFELGTHLTAIAGQNGTQKTTALGILSQMFSITNKENPISSENPLCGGNYKSAFSEKFKLSENDKPKEHEWTLYLDDGKEFPVESLSREGGKLRFWRKGDRSEGSGYLQLPVIYLSLSRLFPIGEDVELKTGDIGLTRDEIEFCQNHHKKILFINEEFKDPNYLESNRKNTLGVNTSTYDWRQNSAGQDNIGKILLAILSFKRLKSKHPKHYSGGILAIDELEATLFPASQEKLVEFLNQFSDELDLQIFFTTHSLEILKKLSPKNNNRNKRNKIVFFKKQNNRSVFHDCTYDDIVEILNVMSKAEAKRNKLTIYTEDEEARCFAKQILGTAITKHLDFVKFNLGSKEYANAVKQKIESFKPSKCIIMLDGDAQSISKKHKHMICLPGKKSPERMIADFLYTLNDDDYLWSKIRKNYSKQVCFRNYTMDEISKHREKAKDWFNEQKRDHWGRNAHIVINRWKKENKEEVDEFIEVLKTKYNDLAQILELTKI